MKRIGAIALFFVAIVILVGAATLPLRPREPAYQGRYLSKWLQDIGSADLVKARQARLAIQEMGTNSLPTLIRMLGKKESFLKRELRSIPGLLAFAIAGALSVAPNHDASELDAWPSFKLCR